MKTNRGLVPDAADGRREPSLILVQAKDDEKFWVNLAEPPTVAHALAYAQAWANLHGVDTRVCRGAKRQVVKEFFGHGQQLTPVSQMPRPTLVRR